MEEPPPTWRSRLKRWRWWIAAACLLIAVRALLPVVLARVVASQASEALHARVEVGDVDLALWKGGVALDDVAVRALATGPSTGSGGTPSTGSGRTEPPAPPEPDEGHPEPPPAFSADAPLIAFKRFAVELRYWPLFSKTIQLRDIQFDSPRVAVDRLASGDLNLMALVPESEVAVEAGATPGTAGPDTTPGEGAAAPTPTPEVEAGDEAPSPWQVGLDRFVLRDGRLRFRDFALEGSEPVEVGIDEVTVNEIALSPGLYGEPARLNLKLGVDEGAIDVAARLRMLEVGFAVSCDVNAQRLPLRRARLYVPRVGWSELVGELDLALGYELETGAKNALSGTITLRDVSVEVPKIGDVAAWRNLTVDIDTVDLIAQRAAIGAVTLEGAKIYARAAGDSPFPVIGALAGTDEAEPDAAEPDAAATGSPTPADKPPKDAGEPAKPWDWSVANVRVADSTVIVLSEQPPLDVGLDLTASKLAAAADATGHVAVGLKLGTAAVDVEGDVRVAPPAFGGTIRIADLAVPPLIAVSGALDPAVLPSAIFSADLAVAAGLPVANGPSGAADLLQVSGTLGLDDLRASPPGQSELTVEAKAIDLAIADLAVPGVIPFGQKAGPDAALRAKVDLSISEPRVARTGELAMSFAAQSVTLAVSEGTVPAALAGLAPAGAPQPLRAVAKLDVDTPQIALPNAKLSAQARTVSLTVSDATLSAVSPESTGAASPARIAAQLDLAEPQASIAEGKELTAGAQAIGLVVSELTLPGVVVGAPPSDTGEPLHAVATLTLAQPRAVRGDGKEFSVAAKSIAVPVTDLAMSGFLPPPGASPDAPIETVPEDAGAGGASGAAPAPVPPAEAPPSGGAKASPQQAPAPGSQAPLRAAFGDIRIDAPAIRVTRTKDGIVLPVAAPASPPAQAAPPAAEPAPTPAAAPAAAAPAPAPAPVEVTIASLRVNDGALDFTDRAVKPVFKTRYDPIEIDARNLRFPNPAVKPLRVELTSSEQGKITLNGELGPQGGALDLKVDDFALTPFNPYATAFSPYGINDGALEIKTSAKFTEGKYEVTNSVTLHQFDLAGAEGDSAFAEQFGIPLTMALALLRDASGDIDLNIPMQVDQSGGASVDVITVVRSALRQALMGAIQSPLKLVGGVIGSKGGGIAPAPIAFPLGRSEPTDAGAESAQRLATFLGGRPGMAVELATAVTADDVRWLHEQSLRGQWEDEGVFQRSFAFLTQRGPRERIGAYLAARAEGATPELSSEDAATLQEWLDQQPPPSPEQLNGLAAARLTAVETVLRNAGIDPGRIAAEPASEPASDDAAAPVVAIRFKPAVLKPTE